MLIMRRITASRRCAVSSSLYCSDSLWPDWWSIFFGCEAMNIDHLRALLSLERQEPVVLCYLDDPALAGFVGASTRPVLLSWETVVKQKQRHPDISFDEYRIVPNVVRCGMAAQERPNELVFCYDHSPEHRYRLMIKVTFPGELFVTSFHRTKPRQTRAILARATLLRRHA
jgi:hypothetical protein